MAKRSGKAADRRARAAAARAAIERAQRRQRWLVWGIGVGLVVVLGVVIGVVVVVGGSGPGNNTVDGVPRTPRTTAVGRTSAPPWPVPDDVAAAVRTAGLPMLDSEGSVEHIHAHLDAIVNGQKMTVPADVGIDQANGSISPLHTHDTTGVIHIESPTKVPFSLGQFLTEWQVSASTDHLGGLKAGGGTLLRAYVNGKAYSGNPAGIILAAHDEIALVYGTVAQQGNPPSSYQFSAGE